MNTRSRNLWAMVIGGAMSAAPGSALARQCGDGWHAVTPQSEGPLTRQLPAFAHDTARDRLVMFGGRVAGVPTGETWEYDLATGAWSQVMVTGPSPRFDAAMEYDPARAVCVLIGGRASDPGSTTLPETWEYNGSAWTLVGSTLIAWQVSMAFYPPLNQVVQVGGWSGENPLQLHNYAAAWNGAVWTALPGNPQSTATPGLAFDPVSNRLFMSGGRGVCPGGVSCNENRTRAFNGASWLQVDSSDAGQTPDLYFDPLRNRLLRERSRNLQAWNGVTFVSLEDGSQLMAGKFLDAARDRLIGINVVGGRFQVWARSLNPTPIYVTFHEPASGPVAVELGDELDLRATALGGLPRQFQWRRDGVPLTDGPGVSGAATSHLIVDVDECTDYAVYDVLVTGPCNATPSETWHVGPPDLFIVSAPANATAANGGSAMFHISATDPNGPIVGYQWRRNGEALTNGSPYSGVNSPTLLVNPTPFTLNGSVFDVAVTRQCGPAYVSDGATLTVTCSGDANGDGIVNFADLNIVLSQFGQSGAGLQGDVTGDGVVNFADLNLVLSRFGAVC